MIDVTHRERGEMLEYQTVTLLPTGDCAIGSKVIEASSSGKLFDVVSLLGLLSFTDKTIKIETFIMSVFCPSL